MATLDTTVVKSRPQSQGRLLGRLPRETLLGYLFVLPALIIIAVFHIFPVSYAIWISLQTGSTRNFKFIGLENYIGALNSQELWNAFGNTIWYVLGTMPFTIGFSLIIAYLLFQNIKGRGVYRALFFMPYVISTVSSSIVWAWAFDPRNGIINIVFKSIGLPPQKWLIDSTPVGELVAQATGWPIPSILNGPSLALVAIMIYAVWNSLGFVIIVFLAGLTNIPPVLYEAARMDGGSGYKLFRHITIPLLSPTLFFVVTISVIGSFQAFSHIFAMNSAAGQPTGGPLGATTVTSIYLFNQLYTRNDPGMASAIGIMLSLVILTLTLIQFRVLGRRVEY
jgi:multiple sugar transport system permease protein